jgi:malonate transporter
MAAVLAALVPVFLLIVAGVLLRRAVVDEVYWRRAEWLVYYVLFPTLFIHTLARADFGAVPAASVGFTLAGTVVLVSLLCLALRRTLAARLHIEGPAFTSLFQGATRWQTSVALAVSAALFGDSGLALAAVAVVAMTPLLNVLNVWILARYASPRPPGWPSVVGMLARNPFIWGIIAGLVINAAQIPIPEPVSTWGAAAGRGARVMGVITVGAGLRLGHLMPLRPITWLSTALKLIVMPAAAIGLGAALGVDGISLEVIACCASVPSTSSAYVLARQMGGDAALMAEIITVQTMLAIVTMPVAIALAS